MEPVDPAEVGGPALPLCSPCLLASYTITPFGNGIRYDALRHPPGSARPPSCPLPCERREPRPRISQKPPHPHTLLKTKVATPPASNALVHGRDDPCVHDGAVVTKLKWERTGSRVSLRHETGAGVWICNLYQLRPHFSECLNSKSVGEG